MMQALYVVGPIIIAIFVAFWNLSARLADLETKVQIMFEWWKENSQ